MSHSSLSAEPADMGPFVRAESHRLGLVYLSLLALALGIVTGLGAVLFRDLIGLLHNLFLPDMRRQPTTPICSRRPAIGAPG